MRIVHASDWHGSPRELPEADLYVFTGDMLLNYPVREKPMDRLRMDGSWGYRISPENEYQRQMSDVKHFVEAGGYRPYLGSPDAPVVCVRGNHDFIDIGHLFEGCNLVHEFVDNEVIEVLGLRVTGHRGIPYIFGSWNDEVKRDELLLRVKAMPVADLFLTHYPPLNVLDYAEASRTRGGPVVEHYGLEGMDFELEQKLFWDDGRTMDAVHCFGHIHEQGGLTKTRYIEDREFRLLYSNAATHFNVIDLETK